MGVIDTLPRFSVSRVPSREVLGFLHRPARLRLPADGGRRAVVRHTGCRQGAWCGFAAVEGWTNASKMAHDGTKWRMKGDLLGRDGVEVGHFVAWVTPFCRWHRGCECARRGEENGKITNRRGEVREWER